MKKLLLLPLIPIAFADEEHASEWNTDMAYGCWTDKHHGTQLGLLHVQGTQRLLPANDTTWLRVELSGSWKPANHGTMFESGKTAGAHADYFGPRKLILPEVALMQYFAGRKVCVVAGMVNLANDIDAVGIANDSFATFSHSAFVNSSVLPLTDSNAAALLRVDFSKCDHGILAVSRTGATPGNNPFTGGPPGFCVLGEYGHTFQECGVTLRINPFYRYLPTKESGDDRAHSHFGMAASVEYEANNHITLFSRAGTGTGSSIGRVSDFSCGAKLKPLPSRPDDFLGLAYGTTKAEEREHIAELVYNLQVSEHVKLMPHIQYTRNTPPSTGKGGFLFGIQAVVSF